VADCEHIPYTPISIPEDWTVEQAEVVLDFLHAVETAVFVAYERPLTERAVLEASGPHPLDVDADDDSIPF